MRVWIGVIAVAALVAGADRASAGPAAQKGRTPASPFVSSQNTGQSTGRVAIPRGPSDDRQEDVDTRDRDRDRGTSTDRDGRVIETSRGGNGNAGNGRGEGPAFCRSGAGHPVHGWQWCADKGFTGAGVRNSPRQDRDPIGSVIQRWPDLPGRTQGRAAPGRR